MKIISISKIDFEKLLDNDFKENNMNKINFIAKTAFNTMQIIRKYNEESEIETFDKLNLERKKQLYKTVYAALNDKEITAKDLHKAWEKAKLEDGWTYGEKTDRKNKIHNCLIPFEKLNVFQRMKDDIFIEITKNLSLELFNEEKQTERKISIKKFLDLDRDEFDCYYYTIATKEEFQNILNDKNYYKLVFDNNHNKVKEAISSVKLEWDYSSEGLEGLEGTGVEYIIIAKKIN